MIPQHQRQQYLDELYALEDRALVLIRRICAAIAEDVREETRYISAKREVFFNSVEDLIHYDPAEGNSEQAELRRIRRETDELFLQRAELDRRMRDSRRRVTETEEDVRLQRAKRFAQEIQVEVARVTPPEGV